MTQPVTLPLYGRLRRHEYRKEELIRVWEEALSAHPVRLRTGERLLRVEKHGESFRVETTRGEVHARHVLLALGRRGTPRKLGVEGEDLEKVAYRLVDAGLYRDRRVLVVGGGDSAVEAALALAAQPGNRVTLSYRKESFFRVKPRNRDKLESAADGLRVTVMLGSRVEAITPEAVHLRVKNDQGELSRILGNDFVFIFAGGVPPFKLLREAGVAFGGDAGAGDARGGQEAAATGTR
jgi:thioredoxin reductase